MLSSGSGAVAEMRLSKVDASTGSDSRRSGGRAGRNLETFFSQSSRAERQVCTIAAWDIA